MTAPSLVELFQALQHGSSLPEDLQSRIAAAGEEGRSRLRLATRLLEALARGPLPEVPEVLRRRALELSPGGARAAGAAAGLERVQEWIARRLDPPGAPAPVAMRGPGRVAHHLYGAGRFEIDLEWVDGATLVGQVVADRANDEAALEDAVCVLCRERDVLEAPVEQNGDFRFADLTPGPFTLTIESPRLRIVLADPPLPPTDPLVD